MNVRRRQAALWFGLALVCAVAPTRGVAAEPTVRVALLIDTSKSMSDRLRSVQDATSDFVRRLRMDDLAQIVSFNSRTQVVQPFTGSVPALEQAIGRLSAGGSTSLFNAAYIMLKEFQSVSVTDRAVMRRQVMILLTDGEDTSSIIRFDELLELAKRSGVVIYAIGMSPSSPRNGGPVLPVLAKETGGAAFFPRRMSDLPGAYAQIWAALSKLNNLPVTTNSPTI